MHQQAVQPVRNAARANARRTPTIWRLGLAAWFLFCMLGAWIANSAEPANPVFYTPAKQNSLLAPSVVTASAEGGKFYVACEATAEVLVFDSVAKKVTARISVTASPSGLALSEDGARLYVTCAGTASTVCIVDLAKRKVIERLPAGYQAQSPVLSRDGRTLYVCNRFNNDVSVFDLATLKEVRRIAVPREPFSAAVTPDGKHLLVANHIHAGRSDEDVVASSVSVIDLAAGKVLKEIPLPNGSTLLRDLRISPDGRYAVVAHILARFHLPTTQIERGWINTSAGSIIDLAEMKLLNTVLFDNIDSGAATPWAVAWTRDGRQLLVTHAGTHELSVVDFPALLEKLGKMPAVVDPGKPVDYTAASRTAADVPNDLSFLVGVRQRLKLPGKGPRSVTVAGGHAWVANYFSDTLNEVDLTADPMRVESFPLGAAPQMTTARLGEFYFNDATICFQGWQACSSCHSHDARVDGMNWDNLNDGIGNPKSAKSLLFAHQTPPSMWLGVRSNAYVSVRAGIRFSLFTVQPPEVADAIDDYLKSLKPMPSPHLVKGKLSPAAERGKKLFFDEKVACADCHKGAFLTDMKLHDVGTVGKFDQPTDRFDTPSLIEVWRSGPYLHDGRAATIRDIFTTFQREDKHGVTSHLTPKQIDDLVEYVLSL
ncbi:MAG: beta-propeller fold lactonase family protein [Verrucomicrobia bacterium]|nr:beta-propeller fold lactonase family protein [Verrucomicrobiota bacterium]